MATQHSKPQSKRSMTGKNKSHFSVGNEFLVGSGGKLLDLRHTSARHIKPMVLQTTTAIRQSTKPPVQLSFIPPRVDKVKRLTFWDSFAYDIAFVLALTLVSSLTPYRDWAFGVYLILALVLRISSLRIFRSALFCLLATPLLIQLKQEQLAEMFAVFSFYFLGVGVVRAIVEMK